MRIKVRFAESETLAGFNTVLGPTTTGVRVADLLDESGVATGYALNQLLSFTAATTIANADVRPDSTPDPDFPVIFFRQAWYIGSSYSEPLSITGLPAGAPYTFSVAGYNYNADRDTTYTVTSGGAPATYLSYTAGDTNTPNPLASITGTVPANGTLIISMDGIQSYGNINGFMLDINPDYPRITETFVADAQEGALASPLTVDYSVHNATTRALIGTAQTTTVTNGAFEVSPEGLAYATEYLIVPILADRSQGTPFFATTQADPAV